MSNEPKVVTFTDEDEEGESTSVIGGVARPSDLTGEKRDRLIRANEICLTVMKYLLSLENEADSTILTAIYQVAANMGYGAVLAGAISRSQLHAALEQGLDAAELNYVSEGGKSGGKA